MLATLVVALIGVAVGFVSWFRPVPHRDQPPPKPTYTEQQIAGAKAKVCAAFGKVQRAVGVANGVPRGSDATGQLADLAHTHVGSTDYTTQLAASAITNLALDAGSRYLLTKLTEEPATPGDLATAVKNEANAEQEALIGYLNGLPASDPQMQPAVNASNEATATVRRSCK